MAHQVIELSDDEPEVKAKGQTKLIEKVHTVFKTKLPPFIDSLTILTIAFWYFFFTGLAVLFNRKLPKEWLRISVYLTKGKVAKRISDMGKAKEEKANTYKVVDLETRRPLGLPVEPMTAP